MKQLRLQAVIGFFAAALALPGQTLSDATLSGAYGFVHLLVKVSPAGAATGAQNLGGVITFDGAGGYTYQGQLGSDAAAATAAAGGGTYSVSSNGFLTLSNPIDAALTINARLGEGAEVLLGASVEAANGARDIFVAVRQPASPVDNSVLNGSYTGAAYLLPDGVDLAAKTALVTLTANGQGGFGDVLADGHAVDQGEVPIQENIQNATYAMNGDGSGIASFGADSTLFSGDRNIHVSADGAFLIGHSTAAGARDVFLAVRNLAGGATDATFSGNFWIVDLLQDRQFSVYTAAVGGIRGNGAGVVSLAQRTNDVRTRNFMGVNFYGLAADGTGFLRDASDPSVRNFAVGAPSAAAALGARPAQAAAPRGFIAAMVDQASDSFNIHGVTFGVRVPSFSGDGVFISPLGVLNAASFAPATAPIAPGTLLSLFGSNLAPGVAQAQTVPLPTTLSGVSVAINGVAAPLFFVSPGQINLQTPFATGGATATVTVTNNGQVSNTVQVPVSPTSPGVFSVQQTGVGPGIITHADFSLVTEQNPAALGETVIVFLTGLGAVAPPFADGTAGPLDPLSVVSDPQLQVRFANEAGAIFFAGAAPGFVGLYQINVTLPLTGLIGAAVPLAIQTSDSFSDFVDIAVGL